MADNKDQTPADGEAADGAAEAPARRKLAGKTLVLFIILPAVLVLGGGGAAAVMLLGGKKPAEAHAAEGHDSSAKPAADGHGDAKSEGHGDGETAAGAHGQASAGSEVGSVSVGASGEPSYYDMPKMLVNLSGSQGERPLLLELELVLEATNPAMFDGVAKQMPRLMDQVQTFLRELRVEDLNGSAGTYRLRLELLKRFNLVLAPAKIDAVLIEGILIQ